MDYSPKLIHAILLVALSFAAFSIGYTYLDGALFAASSVASAVFLAFSFMVMAWINVSQNVMFYAAISQLSDSIAKLSQDQWQALGIRYPVLRVKWDGHPIRYIEDSEITVEEFERFMQDSNAAQISPKRNWTGSDTRSWQKIYNWLEQNDYIRKDSASGQHSALWKGNAFFSLRERYLDTPVIEDQEFMTGAPKTAYKNLE